MNFADVPVPQVYKDSADFRFFLKWIEICLTKYRHDTDNLIDLLDPLRCPARLLWLLGGTCGYVYDERVPIAFNRLVILYFAKMIRYRGSKTGLMLASQLNLAQFNITKYGEEKEILKDRLEDTTVPVNSVSVTSHVDKGYIDIVYYSENNPIDVCNEYVRPLGMYCFSHAGVSINARTKVSVDARLTNLNDGNIMPGPTFVAHYRRKDYASMQNGDEPRQPAYFRNKDYEKEPTPFVDPGLRSLGSLQLSNNEHIVKALLPSLEKPDEIFSLGYDPQNVTVTFPDNYLKNGDDPMYNLRIDKNLEESFTPQVYTVEFAKNVVAPKPAVNPVMSSLGDAISLNESNTTYTEVDMDTGKIKVVGVDAPDEQPT